MKNLSGYFLVAFIAFLSIPSDQASANPTGLGRRPLPVLEMNPDGTLPGDNRNCFTVGSDGIVRFWLIPPQRLRNKRWDTYPGNPIAPEDPSVDVHDEGFDYSNKGLYIDIASIEGGYPGFDQDYMQTPVEKVRTIHLPGSEGKTICLRSLSERVESWFEMIGFHVMASAALTGSSYVSGGYFDNFADAGALQALPHYGMLYVQLKAAEDVRRQLQLRSNLNPGTATCSAAGVFAGAVPLLTAAGTFRPLNNMGLTGGYSTFWLSALAKLLLQCVDYQVVTPVGEYLSPANGSVRQPGSLTMNDAWMGLGGLGTTYATQMIRDLQYTGYIVPKDMWAKIAITSTGSVRTFIRNLNDRYFWRDSEILPLLADGLTMLTITSLDDPSDIMHAYFDEYIKQISFSATGAVVEYSSSEVREWEDYFQSWIDEGTFAIAATGMIQGVVAAAPYVVTPIAKLLSPVTGKVWMAARATSKALPYINHVNDKVARLGTVVSAVKTKAAGSARQVGSLLKTIVQKIPLSDKMTTLVPAATASPPIQTGLSISKGISLRVALKYSGPSSARYMSAVSDMISAASRPGSPFRKVFQADERIVLDYYVLPEP